MTRTLLPLFFVLICFPSLNPQEKDASAKNSDAPRETASASKILDSMASRMDEEEVRNVQNSLINAYLRHDYTVLDQVLADDYTYIDDDGFVLNKQQILHELNSGDDRMNSYKRQDDNVRFFGQTAVMTYRYQEQETYKGHEVGGDMRLTRIFAKRNGHWVMVAAQDTKVNPQPDFTGFSSNDEQTLKQLEQDWLDAYREGNAEKMGKILGDDFVGRWGDGSTQTKHEHGRTDFMGIFDVDPDVPHNCFNPHTDT